MTSNINYYVTMDSQYRDVGQYPTATDFGVSFQTKDKELEYPQGIPYDTTQFFSKSDDRQEFRKSKVRSIPWRNAECFIR